MEYLNIEEQLDEKTKLVISQMEKEIEIKDKELASREEEITYIISFVMILSIISLSTVIK